MVPDGVYFEGKVSMKRTFFWAERWLVVYGDRVEYHQPERPHIPKTVIYMESISVSGILRYHGSYEFALISGKGAHLQRIRIRSARLGETERILAVINSRKQMRRPGAEIREQGKVMEDLRGACAPQIASRRRGNVYPSQFSVNLVVAMLMVFSTLIAPMLNSLFLTGTTAFLVGVFVYALLRLYSVEVPTLHVSLSYGGAHLEELEVNSAGSSNSSINEVGYSTPVPGSPNCPPQIRLGEDGKISVLFSESSKFLSSLASSGDRMACYSMMLSVSEAVIALLQSMPANMAPPADLRVLSPAGINVARSVRIVPDDFDFTKSEWSVIRNRNGLRVLTSKVSSSLTRWPIISSFASVKAPLDAVYRAASIPSIFQRVDDFGGDFQLVDYLELLSDDDQPTSADDDGNDENKAKNHYTLDPENILNPQKAPLLLKYQEMKSVWPVAPRDYLAIQSGFLLDSPNLGRTGRFLIAKSADPAPKDPYPEGHEGFVRGSLTASAFIFLENPTDPRNLTDVWSFLHCDMRGNISGNGKIADFITQSQMPKFFAKLEAVASSVI